MQRYAKDEVAFSGQCAEQLNSIRVVARWMILNWIELDWLIDLSSTCFPSLSLIQVECLAHHSGHMWASYSSAVSLALFKYAERCRIWKAHMKLSSASPKRSEMLVSALCFVVSRLELGSFRQETVGCLMSQVHPIAAIESSWLFHTLPLGQSRKGKCKLPHAPLWQRSHVSRFILGCATTHADLLLKWWPFVTPPMSTIIRFGAVTEFVGLVVSAGFFLLAFVHVVSERSTQTPSEGHHCQCFTVGSCFIGNGFLLVTVVITPHFQVASGPCSVGRCAESDWNSVPWQSVHYWVICGAQCSRLDMTACQEYRYDVDVEPWNPLRNYRFTGFYSTYHDSDN